LSSGQTRFKRDWTGIAVGNPKPELAYAVCVGAHCHGNASRARPPRCYGPQLRADMAHLCMGGPANPMQNEKRQLETALVLEGRAALHGRGGGGGGGGAGDGGRPRGQAGSGGCMGRRARRGTGGLGGEAVRAVSRC
jgi:hypothetical protein